MNPIQMLQEGGVPAIIILVLGLSALAIIIERVKALYVDYAMKTDSFMEQIKGLIYKDQLEEAVTFASANKQKPLAHVVKAALERSDRDEQAINQGVDIAMSEVIPRLNKRLGYLAMISNVSTLVGLLGTINGLIMAFSAVSFADPSQKQTLLAQGISMAMNTTALGLSVAIPTMIAYAFLHARQGSLLEELGENVNKVVDLLNTRYYVPFNKQQSFPSDLESSKVQQQVKVDRHSETKVM